MEQTTTNQAQARKWSMSNLLQHSRLTMLFQEVSLQLRILKLVSYRGFDAYLEYRMNLFYFQDRVTRCLKPLIQYSGVSTQVS